MARRRYLSTEISTDKLVNKMAMKHGDFSALFYSWMIPHVEDNCEITGEPEELLAIVCPWRRDKTTEDVVEAIKAMIEFELILPFNRNGKPMLMVDPNSFYKYQSYISKPNRDYSTREQRETPRNAENHRETPKNTVRVQDPAVRSDECAVPPPPPPPPSLSPSLSPSPPPPLNNGGGEEENNSVGVELNIGHIKQEYEKTFGMINSTIVEDINHYLDDGIQPEVIIAAIKESARQTKRWKYAMGILNNCLIDGAKTIEQYIARTIEFEKRPKKPIGTAPPRAAPVTIDRESEDYKLMIERNDYKGMI